MSPVSLVMPMAGRGSRFSGTGEARPKPLICAGGAPMFAWAVESLRQDVEIAEMVFVVLKAHCDRFGVDAEVRARYPEARIVALDAVTRGAAETAAIGVAALRGDGPVAVNDCDHAFRIGDPDALVYGLETGAEGALVGFAADSPAFSYVALGANGEVTATAEKTVIGPYAIAGCYFFASPGAFQTRYAAYVGACPYPELYVSGLFDAMARDGARVLFQPLAAHASFGTPDELSRWDGAARGLRRPPAA